MMSLDKVTYRFYRLDEGAGECVMLGHTMCASDRIKGETIENPLLYLNYPADPLHWPAIEGTLCCIDMIQAANRSSQLYNIPAQIGSDISMLRCGRTITQKEDGTTANEYTVYGVWQGYEENSDLMSRSVFPLAVMSGQEYRLLYPHDSGNGYSWSMSTKVTRQLSVSEVPLPPGTYYLEYELVDNFMRTARTDRIEINWDGENLTFPGLQSWEGEWIPRWNRKQ
jgi:hypothetical protein